MSALFAPASTLVGDCGNTLREVVIVSCLDDAFSVFELTTVRLVYCVRPPRSRAVASAAEAVQFFGEGDHA